MAKTNELDAAFRATSYRVFLPVGVVDLRIDQPNEVLKSWLAQSGNSMFAIITAHNPESQELDAASNAERQSQFECELLEGNYEPYACENHPDEAGAPFEESCFVPDIQLEDARALAEDFEQNAIVYGGADGIPRLIWIIEAE
jgi:hypothetical protein